MQLILCFVSTLFLYTTAAHTIYRIPDRSDEGGDEQKPGKRYSTDYLDSEYEEVEEEPNPDCKFVGDILRNPDDRCTYLECHYGDEPRYDDRGRLQLFTFARRCPPGTALKDEDDDKSVMFRPIQHDPTKRVSRYDGSASDSYKSVGGSRYKPRYKFKNTYFDKTAICSKIVDTGVCRSY